MITSKYAPDPILFPDPHHDRIDLDATGDALVALLDALDGVRQDPRFHPEGDALFHSLQVFDCARAATRDRRLWAAALLHDVGKAVDGPDHAELGADLLEGLVVPHVVWLVRHHLDLMRAPRATRERLGPGPLLSDLSRLRRFDELGRSPTARVMDPEEAVGILLEQPDGILFDLLALHDHDPEAR